LLLAITCGAQVVDRFPVGWLREPWNSIERALGSLLANAPRPEIRTQRSNAMTLLAGWENFYIILGSAAAGLTGLTFVVIALIADAHTANETGLRAFVTPTIVHFGTVHALSAFLTAPHQTLMSLSIGLGTAGIVGLIYAGIITTSMTRMRRISSEYVPVREDWLWHVIWPTIIYGTFIAMAFFIWWRPEHCLYGVAALTTLLLFIGIHNAWAVAVSISIRKKGDSR